MQYSFANPFPFAHIRAYAIRPYNFWQKNGKCTPEKHIEALEKPPIPSTKHW